MQYYVLVAALVAVASGQVGEPEFVCPESYGDYEDLEYCDYYWRCIDGEPELMLCEDGHAFDPKLRGIIYPCNYDFSVNCTSRELLQEPQPSIDSRCPRKNGIFPDENQCSTYYVCKDGISFPTQCAPGLHVKLEDRQCVWPSVANRDTCVQRETLGNFSCPLEAVDAVDVHGNRESNPTYIHDDCRYFYICLEGVKPVLGGCSEGLVFNDSTHKCDAPENVPGCEDYYNVPAIENFAQENSFGLI